LATKVSPGNAELDGVCVDHKFLTRLCQNLTGVRERLSGPVMILARRVSNPLLTRGYATGFKKRVLAKPFA